MEHSSFLGGTRATGQPSGHHFGQKYVKRLKILHIKIGGREGTFPPTTSTPLLLLKLSKKRRFIHHWRVSPQTLLSIDVLRRPGRSISFHSHWEILLKWEKPGLAFHTWKNYLVLRNEANWPLTSRSQNYAKVKVASNLCESESGQLQRFYNEASWAPCREELSKTIPTALVWPRGICWCWSTPLSIRRHPCLVSIRRHPNVETFLSIVY